MSLAQGNNKPTRPRIEPGSPDPESDALTTRPVRPPIIHYCLVGICPYVIGFVSTNCCLLSVSVIGLFMSIFVG